MDVALLVFLILLNALFAMSEMALTASRKARLQVMVEAGDAGAQAAMDLHDNPTKFLSVVQIGITSIGILNGIVGDAAFSEPFAHWLNATFAIHARAAAITATAMVVIAITFLTIIFGELVPKRIGQMYPETVARLAAQPMEWLSLIARPFVKLLSWCTEATLRLMGVRGGPNRTVTEEELAASLEESVEAGVIEEQEHQMVRNVFRLDDRQVGSMMIPRIEIVWLDANATPEEVLAVIGDEEHSRYPVCRGGLDDVLGIVTAQSLLQPRAELLQDLVSGRVPERVVDFLEVIDVAQDQGQRARVARRPLDLAGEMLAEETPARRARQVVGRGELAVLLHDEAQHRLELADAPRGAQPRPELALGHPPPDALVRSGENARLALRRVIDLGHVNDERRADEGPGAQFANQLRAIGDHDWTELRLEAAERLLVIREALDLEQIGRDPPFQVLAERCVLKDQERLGWWHHAHHDRDSRRRALFAGRGLGRPSLEHTLDDRRVSPGCHFDPLMPEATRTPGDYRLRCGPVFQTSHGRPSLLVRQG